MIWHSSEISEILTKLDVDDKKGLSNGVAEMRLEKYGKNVIKKIERPSFAKRFVSQLTSKPVIALILIALISFAVSLIYAEANIFSPILIIAIVIINALISAYHLHNCDHALDNFKSMSHPSVSVLRDGIVKTINSDDLVPGDIILLEAGDYVCADARIIDCTEFRCNEVSVTGEEIPAPKNANATVEDITALEKRNNMIYMGSTVVHGSAKAVVVSTGLYTELGHTETILQQTGADKLPLQKELDGLGNAVNIIILAICAVVFVIGMIQNFSSGSFASMTLKVLMNAAALAVAAIPEGLPAIATIVIAIGIQRIMHDNIIIKDAGALETIGKTSVICCDKTGILTRNKMKLSYIFDGKKTTDVESEALEDSASMVLRLAAICSTLENDSTEVAIDNACLAYNSFSKEDVENIYPRLTVIPFDSERKSMTTVNMINERPFAIVKGAPEIVIPKCTGCNNEELLKVNDLMADEALRVICIAIRPLDTIPANPNPDEIEKELTFVGLLGLIDPPRDGVIADIETCDSAGIKTVMLTGDNITTAKAVARRIGILKDGMDAISGAELSEMSDDELTNNIAKYSVFARITPNDKVRIIKAFQKNGMTVTVTGDGLADAEALAAADVGCAMGKFGTDVAKGNADVIITNSRFCSIVSAIRESRGLFSNIKKSVNYLLSCNMAEILTVFFGLLVFKNMPVSAVQLLWINLLTDCAPAISISMESADKSVMNRRPSAVSNMFDINSSIHSAVCCLFITVMSVLSYTIGIGSGVASAMSMTFLTLGASQIFNCYANKFSGSVLNSGIFKNQFMNISCFATLLIMIFLVVTPAGYVFGLTILPVSRFLLCILFAFLVIPVSEITKYICFVVNKNR